jgi:hypothetical protein
LFYDDKKFREKKSEDYGLGRNCVLFNEMRKLAYKESRKSKSREELFLTILDAGLSMNIGFCPPLSAREVRAIAKSVAKWVWARFSPERFSEIQSQRGSRPWRHREVLSRLKPWEEMGISESTYYRRKRNKTL